jgi:hypothetical protein
MQTKKIRYAEFPIQYATLIKMLQKRIALDKLGPLASCSPFFAFIIIKLEDEYN